MLIDTHSHVNFKAFKDDGKEVIKRAIEQKTWMILVGAESKTSKRAIEYANLYDKGVYAAVGLHPIHLQETEVEEEDKNGQENYKFKTRGEDFAYEKYYKLANSDNVVAIGEIGLDYHHINLDSDIVQIKNKQKEVLWQQLLLAKDLDLPVIIHCRQAHYDLLELLKKFKKEYKQELSDKTWGVVHCFSGDEDLAWQYFNLGLMISFTGLITFSKQWESLIRKVPLNKIMIETDSPFMSPEPHRGKRNEPLLVYYVAKKIADIRNIKLEEVAETTSNNAIDFFGLD